jgi:uncharacterized protein (TIGR02594 family)
MIEPAWLVEARKHIGMREVPGAATAPTISRWLADLGAWWRDDETPWCGVAVAAWVKAAGLPLPKHWYRARAWLDYGEPMAAPAVGCIVIFEREGGGHVGLLVGEDEKRRLCVLGGNQGNRVSIAPFDRDRLLGFRWPDPSVRHYPHLPIISSTAASSRNEA